MEADNDPWPQRTVHTRQVLLDECVLLTPAHEVLLRAELQEVHGPHIHRVPVFMGGHVGGLEALLVWHATLPTRVLGPAVARRGFGARGIEERKLGQQD